MRKNKIKILFDVSHGIWGSSGIQQDMRRILVGLLREEIFEVDLLIYDMVNNYFYNTFNMKEEVKNYGSLVAQSRLLYYFTNPPATNPFGKGVLGRIKSKVYRKHLIKKGNRRKINCITLDNRFNEVIYKKLLKDDFDKTLLKKLFYDVHTLMADLSTEGLVLGMMNKKFTPPYLDTRKYDVAIFFQELPVRISKKTLKIVRSYDLIQIFNPDVVFKADYRANYQYRSIKFCKQQQSQFCTISKYVAKQIREVFGEDTDTFFIPVAISDIFEQKNEKFSISKFVRKYVSGEKTLKKCVPEKDFDYLLSVSTIEPRKNILSIYQAFKRLKLSLDNDLKLVLVGKRGWNLDNSYIGMFADEDVFILENVPTEELPYLYSNARVFIYIPFQEGFGLPPAEAMACGCPVILSDIPVHREIHQGGEPIFVDPYDVDDIYAKLNSLFKMDRESINKRIKKALKHVKTYRINEIAKQWKSFILESLG